ncbi:HAMP domain-containing histidine kinase [Clostridium sp. MSJ-4]|uniref:histidine kinase n=1 Tax=Clostridium simiarum TaxID=2841506 RepID=A0ABS6EYV2_9CLOT|nr:HAMP domain-containing sensor histidine kinase [Clostridium simiarum]MBU5591396.1 HAMP domain-containing histidine kinase [Clostridium simiarum]
MKNRIPSIKNRVKKFYAFVRKSIKEQLRLQLLVVIAICLTLCGLILGIFQTSYIKSNSMNTYTSYSEGITRIDSNTLDLGNYIETKNLSINDKDEIKNLIIENSYTRDKGINIVITDLDGNIIYSKEDFVASKLSIENIMRTSMEYRKNSYDKNLFYSIYPLKFKDSNGYLILSAVPSPTEHNQYHYGTRFSILGIILALIAFILLFLLLTRKKVKYIEEISHGLIQISTGNLDYNIDIKGYDELSKLAQNINYMEKELKNKIEETTKAENTKSELITNVSHDLKTPLTSIMGYLGLLKDGKYEDEDQMKDYLDIAFNKSQKLKILIEDLFEYTKLSNKGIPLNKKNVSFNELIEQLIYELVPVAEENEIILHKDIEPSKILVNIDGDKMVRVFENLLMNAIKYSYKPSTVYIKLYKEDSEAILCISNKGDSFSDSDLNKVFDRFYRVEKSRSSSEGGSGLGLAISKSIVELHEGNIWAECHGNDIKFFVSLKI